MDLADGTLVTLAESQRIKKVFTLDHKDFRIYKPARIKNFTLKLQALKFCFCAFCALLRLYQCWFFLNPLLCYQIGLDNFLNFIKRIKTCHPLFPTKYLIFEMRPSSSIFCIKKCNSFMINHTHRQNFLRFWHKKHKKPACNLRIPNPFFCTFCLIPTAYPSIFSMLSNLFILTFPSS